MSTQDGCAEGDRHCTVPHDRQTMPVVWVGPKDGRWIKVVDLDEVEPSAPKPCPPYEVDRDRAIIFAAIASFRDSLCSQTLYGMFTRAKHPDRLRVAVVQQNAVEDEDCLEAYCRLDPTCRRSQVAVKRFDASEAKGPTWARAQDADMLPDSAEFCLRTDSHMAFAHHWDSKQIDQWYLASNEFAVLSTYVADATQIQTDGTEVNVNGKWEVPHLCSIQWENGHVRNMQAKAARNLLKPKLTTLWAAGLSFARCHAERAVPYDPHTPYIFWGEEFSRTARFFTRGYDIYTPPRTIVAHDYKHTQGDPNHFKWNGKGGPRLGRNQTILAVRRDSNRRIWSLLGMPGRDPNLDLGPIYGLGSTRSLDQLIDFTGINLRNRSITANRCGNIDWVPWDCARKTEDLRRTSLAERDTAAAAASHVTNERTTVPADDDPLNDALAALRIERGRDQQAEQSTALHGERITAPTYRLYVAGLASTACFAALLCLFPRGRFRKRRNARYHLTKVV